jgi:hypothetical protein
MVDKKIKGKKYDSNKIVVIAACNPYQIIKEKERKFISGLS